jgi:DNA-binding GntR family transcriptional regulator
MDKVTAYQHFKEKLLSGQLLPGQFVTQKELASLAGVPLGAAREAIQKLEAENLLKVHPQRGIQIADLTTRFIHNAFGLRLLLERQAIREFADAGPAHLIAELLDSTETILKDVRATLSEANLSRAVEVDWRMHDVIIEQMGNELIRETYQINATRIRLIRVNNRLTPDRVVSNLEEHVEMLRLCRDRLPEEAARAMEAHIAISKNRALQGR